MTDGLTDGRVSRSESKMNSCAFAAVARQESGLSESANTPSINTCGVGHIMLCFVEKCRDRSNAQENKSDSANGHSNCSLKVALKNL